MVLRSSLRAFGRLCASALVALAGCARHPAPPPEQHHRIISPARASVLKALPADPGDLRRRDIADQPYSEEFLQRFSYEDTEASEARVEWESGPGPLRGAVIARGLKPNFAYQLKLWAKESIRATDEAGNRGEVRALSGYRLGALGRWWCEQCRWNVDDAELHSHVPEGHTVVGYLLFDWLVTDPRGNARHAFRVDSSYHVLWTREQRRPRRHDPPPRSYEFVREAYGYPPEAVGTRGAVRIFPEWEVNRPLPGEVRLPPGEYEALLDITEESFHANLPEPDELGGFWARALADTVRFTVEE